MGGILRGGKWEMFQNRQFVAYFGRIVFLKAAAIGQGSDSEEAWQ